LRRDEEDKRQALKENRVEGGRLSGRCEFLRWEKFGYIFGWLRRSREARIRN
jgi:hypothetical protein